MRDTVSLFLGNFFLLFLQSCPLETLKIKLPPNFSHLSLARFPRVLMKQRNNCFFGFYFHLTGCLRAVQCSSEAERSQQKSQARGPVLTAAILCVLHGQVQKNITGCMMSKVESQSCFTYSYKEGKGSAVWST